MATLTERLETAVPTRVAILERQVEVLSRQVAALLDEHDVVVDVRVSPRDSFEQTVNDPR